jgi:hypothetical protein
MKRNVTTALLALALAGLTFHAVAESTELAINPTGTWKLTTGTNAASPQTLKLKLEGEKVTGFGTHSYAVSYIKNVRQPTDTNKVSISKYQGTISGDTIKGKVERHSFMGGDRTLDWQAKRVR